MQDDLIEQCTVCGQTISKRSRACPHCGDPKYRADPVTSVFGCINGLVQLAIALVVLLWLVASAGSFLLKKIFNHVSFPI